MRPLRRIPPRHERRGRRQRRQTNRGLGAGPSMFCWYSTRSRHHLAECPDTCGEESQRNAADIDGAVLINARREEAKYPELAACRRCKLVVAIETQEVGGVRRAVDFLRQLSISKAQEVPSFM